MFGKKEKLETEKFDLDADLDFDDFGSEDYGLDLDTKPKSRSPVYNVAAGTISGIKSKFTDPGFLHSALKSVLPDTYGEITQAVNIGATGLVSLYDDAVKEVKPQVARIAKKVDKLIPAESKRIKALTTKISNFFGNEVRPDNDYKADQQNQSVTNALAEVFGAQQDADNDREARSAAEGQIKENIEKKRFTSSFGVLSSINDSVGRMARYNEKINQAFQRKTLELQFRSYFIQAEMLEEQKKHNEISRAQGEAIAKNTALPEFVKIKSSEKFAELAKNKFFGSVQSGLFGDGNALKDGIKRMKTDVISYMRGLSSQLEMAQMGLDSVETAVEMNKMMAESGMSMSGSEMAGNMAGAHIAEWGKEKFTKYVKPIVDKHKPTSEFLAKGANVAANIPGAVRRLRDSDKLKELKKTDGATGAAADIVDKILGYFTDTRPESKVEQPYSSKSLPQPAIFDTKVHKTIVDIIPGFLARIHQELVATRTKSKKPGLISYDFHSDSFKTSKEIGDSFIGRLDNAAKRSFHNYKADSAARDLLDGTNVDDDELVAIKKFLSKMSARANFDFTPANITGSAEFSELAPKTAVKFKKALTEYIDKDDSPAYNQLKLTKQMRELRSTTTDLRGEVEMFIKAGYGDILVDKGLATRDETGDYDINNEALLEFAREHGIVTSDKHAKCGIKKVQNGKLAGTIASVAAGNAKRARSKGVKQSRVNSKVNNLKSKKAEAAQSSKGGLFGKLISRAGSKLGGKASLEAIKKTRIYKWFYKDGRSDDKEHIGPMAQDVKANMGEQAAPGGTTLDISTMNGITMSAIQELADRQNKQVDSKSAVDILASIKEDTAAIVSGGSGGFSGTGPGFKLGTSNSYLGLLGDIAGSLQALVGKSARGIGSAAKKGYVAARDKVIKPTGKMLANFWQDKKDPAAKAFKKMMGKAADLASGALDFGKKAITDYIPATAKTVRDYLVKAKNFAKGILNGPVDIYLKDTLVPVIRAELLRMGQYKDEITGKVITSLDDLNKIKGNIVNQYGEVVLSVEDAARGLYDKHGNKICSSFTKAAKVIAGLAVKGWKALKKTGKTLLGGLSNIGGPLVGGLKDLFSKLTGDWGFGTGKIYSVLVEMRDIMKGRNPPDHEDRAEFDKNFVGPMPQTRPGASSVNLKALATKAGNFLTNRLAPKGEHTEDVVDKGLGVAKNVISGTKDKITGAFRRLRGQSDDFVGPMPQSAIGKGLDKLKKHGEAAKAKAEFDQNFVGPKKPGLLGKLKSGIGAALGKAKDGARSAIGAANKGLQSLDGEEGGGLASSAMSMAQALHETSVKGRANKAKKPSIRKKTGKKATSKAQRVDSGEESRNDGDEKSAEAFAAANSGPKYMAGDVFNTIGKGAKLAAVGAIKAGKFYAGRKDKIKAKDKEEPESEEVAAKKDAASPSKKGRAVRRAARKAVADKPGLSKKSATIKAASTKSKVDAAKKKHAFNDKDGDGKRDGNADDRLKRAAELKKANRNADAKVDLDPKYKEANFIDTITNGVTKLLKMLSGGAAAVFGTIGSLLSIKSIGGLLTKLTGTGGTISKVAKTALNVAKSPFKAIGGAVKLAGKVGRPLATGIRAIRGAATIARVASVARMGLMAGSLLSTGVASTLMAGAGAAISAVGAVLASPVVLGALAVAATAYVAYKAYKYFTRDKANAYENIRLKQYGLNGSDAAKKNNHLIFELEEYLLDGKVGYDEGKAFILDKKVDSKEMLSIFDIEPEDTPRVDKFNEWMAKRFKPFFLTTLTALFSIDKKTKLKDVCDLSTDKRLKFLNLSKYEGGPYDVLASPFANLETLASTKDATMQAVKLESDAIIEKMKKDGDFIPFKKKPPKPKVAPPPPKPKAPEKPKVPEPEVKKEPKGYTATGEDEDGKMMAKVMSAQNDPDKIASSQAKPKEADGPIADGSKGMAFIKTRPNVKLEGLLPAYAQNLKAMAQEYGEMTGDSLLVKSGVRTKEQQQALHNADPTAAKPGRSLHEFGLALDIDGSDLDKADELGLMRKYGFTRPVGGEDWHMEPAGIQGNIKKAKEDQNFAEEATEASLYKGGGGYGSIKGTPKGKRDTNGALALMDIAADKASVPSKKTELETKAVTPAPEAKSEPSLPREEDTIKMGTTAKRLPKVAEEDTIKMGTTAKRPPTSIAGNGQSSKIEGLPDSEHEPSKIAMDTSKGGDLHDTIITLSKKAGVDPGLMTALAAVESGMNPNAKAKGTSASGAFQFVDRTWRETVSKYGRKYGIDGSASPFDINASTLMASEYVKSNIRILKSVRSDPNITDVYLAHLLGPTGARTILKASPNSIAAEILPAAAKSNRDLFYQNGRALTVGEFYSLVQNRVATKAKRFGVNVGTGEVSAPTGSSTMDDDDPNSREVRRANGGSIAVGEKRLPKTSLGDEAGFPAGFDESLFTQQAPTAISQAGTQSTDRNSGMGSETFGEMTSTLAKSLSVQEEIRDILQQILDNSASLEKGATSGSMDQYEDTSRTDEGFGRSGGFKSAGTFIESAIDLRRRMA